jgi:thiopurine S-methyltransferase
MDVSFWQERWGTRQIGFHEGAPNAMLAKHIRKLLPRGQSSRVYVPLCGKADDLFALQQAGAEVVGTEFMPEAIAEFFAEHGMTPTVDAHRSFVRSRAERITLLEGDAFDVNARALGGRVEAIFDRAALVAIEPTRRREYADICRKVLAPGGRMLLVAFEYPQSKLPGPPWSVSADDVHALFHDLRPTLLGRHEVSANARFVAAGLHHIHEAAWLLQQAEA